MKLSAAIVCGVLATASSSFAGLSYDFTSVSTGATNQTFAGSVKAEGKRIRIDIRKGDGVMFKNGAFVVSSDGGQTMTVVDPAAKSFYLLNLAALLGGTDSLLRQFGGAVKFDVRNPKVAVTGGAGSETLEGFATKKSTVKSDYEIVVEGLGKPLTMRMRLSTDVWWTDKVSSDFTNFLQMRGLRTGVEAVDRMLAAQSGAIKGFPLRQVTTTKVAMSGNEMTTTSTSIVKNLKNLKVAPATFAVPTGLVKVANPMEQMLARKAVNR